MKLRTVVLFLLAAPLLALAQEQVTENIQITGMLRLVNNVNQPVEDPGVRYGVMNKSLAKTFEEKMKEMMKATYDEQKISEMCDEYMIDQTTMDGYFKTFALPTMVLVFVHPEASQLLIVPLEPGKTKYDIEMKLEKVLQEGKGRGNIKFKEINQLRTEDVGDGNSRFGVHIELPRGVAHTESRMILQLFAVDCQTGDTVDYVTSMVFEGEKYHQTQDKRMNFNYEKNDKLAKYYHPEIVLQENVPFKLDTVIVWKKPKGAENRSFRGPCEYVFEDFHHVYHNMDMPSNCMTYKPFKLLDFTPALQTMPLTSEFYIKAGGQMQEKETIVDLHFEMGTSKLIQDEQNDLVRQQFVTEISSHGKTLAEVVIVGGASPDGVLRRNQELALQRANVAKNMLGHIAITPRISSKVFTWEDVVKELRQQEKTAQADRVEAIIGSGGDETSWFNQIKSLPFYDYDVVPVLNSQRTMRCQYKYQTKKTMNAEESLQEFHAYKKQYFNGEKHFTTGDFYNLFGVLKDSMDIDTLTTIAYNEIKDEVGYALRNPMAPYICNLKAIQLMKRGIPNLEILRPFINMRRGNKNSLDINYEEFVNGRGKIRFNRQQIVANQAICYFMEEKGDTAQWLVDCLKKSQLAGEGLGHLADLVNLKKLYGNRASLTGQEKADYERVKASVLSRGNDNKAILYTEIEEWGGRNVAMTYINRMDDNNPKKWYLKGLLAAIKLSKSEDGDPMAEGKFKEIPQHLAYFQHAYDMDPTKKFRGYYDNEVQVDLKVRKMYPYRKKNVELYRELFKALKKRDDLSARYDATDVEANDKREATKE